MSRKKPSLKYTFFIIISILIIVIVASYIIVRENFTKNIKSHIIEHQKIIGLLTVDTLEEGILRQKYIYYEKFKDKTLSRSLFIGKDIKNAYIVSNKGIVKRIYKKAENFYLYPGIDISKTTFFKYILNMQEEFDIIPIMYSPFSNRLIRSFVLKKGNEYLVVDINLIRWSKYFRQIRSYKNTLIALSRFGGIIISKSDSKRFPLVTVEERCCVKLIRKEKFIMEPIYSNVLKEKLFILIPYHILYSDFSSIINFTTLMFIIVIIVLILLFLWQVKHIIFPLSRLSQAISKFNLERPLSVAIIPRAKYKELNNLQEAFLNASYRLSEDAKRLKETSIYLTTLIEHFPNGIIIVNPENMTIEAINEKIEKLLKKFSKETIGQNLYEVFPFFEEYKKYLEDEKKEGRFKIKRKDKILEVKISEASDNNFSRIIIQIDDVTEREKLEEKMNQIKRMETVNLLSRGFSHDFNNLLNALYGYIEILCSTQDPTKKEEVMTKLRDVLETAEELVKKIQILSKATRINKEKITVKEFLIPSLGELKNEENINKVINADEIINETIYGDPYLLGICISNILENAKEAIKGNKNPEIKIYGTKREVNGNIYITIIIEDNGEGMSKETRERIFEPFFTTKGLGKRRGTGLGMTIVYGIIDAHNGTIEIESEEGKGTRVIISFPAAKE